MAETVSKWKRRYWKNPEKRRAISRAYRKKNLASVRAKNSKWQSDRWIYRQAYMRRYYQKNRDKIRSKAKGYYNSHQKEVYAASKRWHKQNQEKVRAYSKKCYLKNKSTAFAAAAHRRALKAKATINLKQINQWVKAVKSKATFICHWCQDRFPISRLHIDHIIPLSKGGMHSIENLCASCDTCNFSKNDNLVKEWYRAGQLVLGI